MLVHRCTLSDCSPIGALSKIILNVELSQAIYDQFSIHLTMGTVFERAVVNHVTYYSQAYRRTKKRNSYTVAFKDGEVIKFGFIQRYISLSSFTVAVITPLIPTDSYCYSRHLPMLRNYLIPVVTLSSVAVVAVSSFIHKLVCINIDSSLYVARQPNSYYFD